MRKSILTALIGLSLTGCATTPDDTGDDDPASSAEIVQETAAAQLPYADLADNSLLVRFEPNPDVAAGQCNPKVWFALRTTEDAILINANFEIVDLNLTGAGLAIFDQDGAGVATNSTELNMFAPYPVPCSDLQVRVQDLRCRLEDDPDSAPCPNPVFEGTEIFASFRGLPNY